MLKHTTYPVFVELIVTTGTSFTGATFTVTVAVPLIGPVQCSSFIAVIV
ncbi:MAG: hypothetical protein IPG32_13010 [Saprospirales bacterium]|nr:hypothetical protein [Saprospirales bacterium]